MIIDGYLKQEFIEYQPSTVIAYLRPGANAVQLTSSSTSSSSSQRSGNTIHIELTIRIEQMTNQHVEGSANSKHSLLEQVNEQCLAELKAELKLIFHTSTYSNIISEQTIKDLVKLMP